MGNVKGVNPEMPEHNDKMISQLNVGEYSFVVPLTNLEATIVYLFSRMTVSWLTQDEIAHNLPVINRENINDALSDMVAAGILKQKNDGGSETGMGNIDGRRYFAFHAEEREVTVRRREIR